MNFFVHTIDKKFNEGILKPNDINIVTDNVNNLWFVNKLFGAALMLRTTAIKETGGFDPLFFAYGEEEDLCRRIQRHGYKLAITKKSPVTHLRTNEAKGVSDFILFLRLKGSYLLDLKNPQIGYPRTLRRVMTTLLSDFIFNKKQRYPFNSFNINRRHILKSAFWILANIVRVWEHRKMEEISPYLDI